MQQNLHTLDEQKESQCRGCALARTKKVKFEGLGWIVRLQQKGKQFFLTLAKEIALGNVLQKGDSLH